MTAAADKAQDLVRQLRGLLEGLGIDPDALEVRIGIRRPGEQERPHRVGGTIDPDAVETGEGKLTGKLLEALSLLCQAGEKFMSYMGESQQQMIEAAGGPSGDPRVRRPQRKMGASRQVRGLPCKVMGMMLIVAARTVEAWRAALTLGAGEEAPRSARDSGMWWC